VAQTENHQLAELEMQFYKNFCNWQASDGTEPALKVEKLKCKFESNKFVLIAIVAF